MEKPGSNTVSSSYATPSPPQALRDSGLKRRAFKRTSQASQDCLKLLRVVFPLLVAPLCFCSFIYTCFYAYIYAREGSYGAQDWQKCLTVPNIGNLHRDNNRFCTSASNFAGQAYLSVLVAVGGLQIGLKDNDLLWFSWFTCLVGVVGITIFRESYPYFLDPHFMSTTLLTLSKYIHPGMYDDLASSTHLPAELKDKIPSSEVCKTAYQVNLAFLAIQYGVLSLSILLSLLCLYALLSRPRRGGARVRMKGRKSLVFFGVTAFAGMVTMLISKEKVAELAIKVAAEDAHDTSFPFLDNNLDLVSLTTLLAIGTAFYAVCKPSLLALSICMGVSAFNTVRSVPGMLGTMAAYSGIYYPTLKEGPDGSHAVLAETHYVLWNRAQCAQYVQVTNPGAFSVDPNADENSSNMCYFFVSSITGQLITWVSILSLAVTAYWVMKQNPNIDKDREEEEEKRWAGRKRTEGGREELQRPLLWEAEEKDEEEQEERGGERVGKEEVEGIGV